MPRVLLSLAATLTLACTSPVAARAPETGPSPVEATASPPVLSAAAAPAASDAAAFAALERESQGRLGVFIAHLPSGRTMLYRAEEPFSMASTFKVAVALSVARRVDAHELRWADTLHLGAADMRPGMGDGIAERWPRGVDLSIGDLAKAMIEESDNSACDALLARVGGPPQVTSMLSSLGVVGMRVDRSELELGREAPGEHAANDLRDTTTPRAMGELLSRVVSGDLASPASTELLRAWLRGATTGPRRLTAGLPRGAMLMHKTGTGVGVTNDAGVVELADGSRLVISAYLGRSTAPMAVREAVLAKVARLAFDAFGGPLR
jgi:beta-lactamase class A